MIAVKRVYEKVSSADGFRVLVDRLWPRGMSKQEAHVDLWLKDVAPSAELRKWFHHEPAKWTEFQKRYRRELEDNSDAVALLKQKAAEGTLTLVYGARDEEHNNAVVLKTVIETRR